MHMYTACVPVQFSNCALYAVFQYHNNNSPAWLSAVCSGALVSVVTAEWCHIIWGGGGARLCCREYSMVKQATSSVLSNHYKSLNTHTLVARRTACKSQLGITKHHNWRMFTHTFETYRRKQQTRIRMQCILCNMQKKDLICLVNKQINTHWANRRGGYLPVQLTYIYRLPNSPTHSIWLC